MTTISTAATTARQTYAPAPLSRQEAEAKAAARKREVDRDANIARSSPRMSASEDAKHRAKAKLEEIKKRLQILKKLFGANPKEMARALAQIFKELRAAVKAYKDAGGDELKLSADVSAAAVAADPEASKADGDNTDAKDVDATEADAKAPDDKAVDGKSADDKTSDPSAAEAKDGTSLYDAVNGQVRKSIGEDGLDFARTVRSMSNAISDILETARIQYRGRKPDKDTDKQFESADKELKGLHDDLTDMERDIHNAVPDAGMRLSVAA